MAPTRPKTPVWIWFAVLNFAALVGIAGYLYVQFDQQRLDRTVRQKTAKATSRTTKKPVPQKPAAPEVDDEAAAPTAAPAEIAASNPETKPNASIADVVDQVDDGIVLITIRNSKGNDLGFGSGFIIDDDGLVLTNYHVLRGASSAVIQFRDGTEVRLAGLRGWDAERDLALVEMRSHPLTFDSLKLSDKPAAQGEAVIAIGHPQGFRFTTTTGIISATYMSDQLPGRYKELIHAPADQQWLQTDAGISHGNSGGPLLDRQGTVVGINTWLVPQAGLGFAIDARHARDLYARKTAESVPFSAVTEPEYKVKECVSEYQVRMEWFAARAAELKSDEERAKLTQSTHPALEFSRKLMELARTSPQTPARFETLCSVCGMCSDAGLPTACNDLFEEAARLLKDEFWNEPRWDRFAWSMRDCTGSQGHAMLRDLADRHPLAKVQAISELSLAVALRSMSGKDPNLADESIRLLEHVQSEHGQQEFMGSTMEKLIEPLLYETKYLLVGRKPPGIQGRTSTGESFHLSDYLGKVVVVDFFVDWCPHCVEMYPLERELVTRHADRPFALLGVNCDDPERLKQLQGDQTVTWRCWSDGQQGPIAEEWRVSGFPTLYVLDHEGIIRYQGVRGKELEQAIDELLKKVPATESLPVSALEAISSVSP